MGTDGDSDEVKEHSPTMKAAEEDLLLLLLLLLFVAGAFVLVNAGTEPETGTAPVGGRVGNSEGILRDISELFRMIRQDFI